MGAGERGGPTIAAAPSCPQGSRRPRAPWGHMELGVADPRDRLSQPPFVVLLCLGGPA